VRNTTLIDFFVNYLTLILENIMRIDKYLVRRYYKTRNMVTEAVKEKITLNAKLPNHQRGFSYR
jgi:hypothetical protein